MLNGVFVHILDMTYTASIVIFVVLLARVLLKRAPKIISYCLWAVALFRLLCPWMPTAPVSVMPAAAPVTSQYTFVDDEISIVDAGEIAYQAVENVFSGKHITQEIAIPQTALQSQETPETQMNTQLQEVPKDEDQNIFQESYVEINLADLAILAGQFLWLAGVLAMVGYSLLSYIMLRRKLRVRMLLRDNIYLADDITSPFVVGMIRPRIYLPGGLGEKEQAYIILHEQHHIKRFDHVIKLLAFLALTLHWFNPLVWMAFILANRDMEMSCDEAVIRKLGSQVRAEYSASLVALATGRQIIGATPLAFGEGDTKGRIRNLANWKKPALWIVLIGLLVCVILAICLLTNPAESVESPAEPTVSETQPTENTASAPTESTAPQPEETTEPVPTETEPTQPPRTWIPQDPDPLTYADDEIQATLLFYVGGLYVHDNREDAVTETLPEGYFYAASTVMEDNYSIPEKVLWACHIPDLTAVYAYEENPDYIYYTLESGGKTVYRRMIRAALVENYWGGESLDEALPEDYRLMLFQVMISNFKVGIYNPYGQIEGHEFATPQDVDLYTLFYNGFADLRQNVLPLTDEERQFLLASGQWGEGPGREKQHIGNAIRIPISRMDEMLRRYFGIGFADTNKVGVEKWDTFWAEKQCYYTWRSDFNAGFATVTAVAVEGDIYKIRYFHDTRRADVYIMTLERVGNVLIIRSNEKPELNEQKTRDLIHDYFYQRFSFLQGNIETIATANAAMVEDELLHREKIQAAGLELVEYTLVIDELDCGDTNAQVIVKETIVYLKNGERKTETVEHRVFVYLDHSGEVLVCADGYRMEGSDFSSCSYVPPEILEQVKSKQ